LGFSISGSGGTVCRRRDFLSGLKRETLNQRRIDPRHLDRDRYAATAHLVKRAPWLVASADRDPEFPVVGAREELKQWLIDSQSLLRAA
jgi:hypothetical protein